MEAVAIADTGDLSKQGPPTILVGMYVLDAGYAAQVDAVELKSAKEDGGHHEGRHPGARVLVVVHVQRVIPTHGLCRLVGVREEGTLPVVSRARGSGGRPRLPWPWHLAVVTSGPRWWVAWASES